MNKCGSLMAIVLLALFVSTNFRSASSTTYSITYSGYTAILGDATYACPSVTVGPSDISMTSTTLTANVNKKAAMTHADSFYKVWTSISTVTYSIEFSIPYTPNPNPSQTDNPQTMESAVEFYNGADPAHPKYIAGIQWVINPWVTQHFNVWQNGQWVSTHYNLNIVANANYRYRIHLDWQNPQNSYVAVDEWERVWWFWWQWAQLGSWQSFGIASQPTWGSDAAFWVTAESISAWPDCSSNNGFIDPNNWSNPLLQTT